MATDMTVANEILRQLGGREFIRMTGAKSLTGDASSLSMSIARNASGATRLKVTLNPNDLYDLEFGRTYRHQLKLVAAHENVHVEDLRATFSGVTGMDTRLPRIVGINA